MRSVYRKKGSITVFLTMLLLLTASFFSALLEAARIKGLGTEADVVSDTAMESVFAEYQKTIYENYGLLMLDGAYGSGHFGIGRVEQRLKEMNDKNLCDPGGKGRDFYRIETEVCKISKYQLVTDGEGAVFRRLAAEMAKREIGVSSAEDFTNEILQKKELESRNGRVETHLENAGKKKEEVLKEEFQKENNISASNMPQDVNNPIDSAREWKKSRVLSLVVREESLLSQKAISLEQTLENRIKEQGNLPVQSAALEEVWFLEYLETHMGRYGAPQKDHALDYEMEYILKGYASDRENLEYTVKNLIMIREVMNMAYLIGDSSKCMEAEQLAVTLMGWTVNPAVVSVTKWGILAAWAYSESILDVRALLEGRKIAWIKNAEQWSGEIGTIKESVDGFAMSEDCENGWDYTGYLKFLICLTKDSAINFRSMDVIEVNTNILQNEEIKMDNMLTECESRMTYEAEPLFWRYVNIDGPGLDTFRIYRSKKYTYL